MSAKTATEDQQSPLVDPAAAPLSRAGRPKFGGLSLRVRLLLLLAVAILPAVVAGTITAITRYEAGLAETRANLRALSVLAVNRHLETLAETSRLLQTMANLPDIVSFDAQRCSALLARQYGDRDGELASRYTNIVAIDRENTIRCSALPMEPDRKYSNPQQLQAVLATKAFNIGGLTIGGFSNARLLSAAAPLVAPDGRVVGAIATGIKAEYLESQFQAYKLPQGSKLALVDGSGSSLLNRGDYSWQMPTAPIIAAALADGEREFRHDAGGRTYLVVLDQIGDYDMFVLAALPSNTATDAVTGRLVTDIGEILLFALLAALGVLFGAQFLVLAPIARFRRAVRAYRRDGSGFVFDSSSAPIEIAELAQDFEGMAHDVDARQENMKALLRQRDLLVRETNHRVKNNLQIVASLLSLQARRISEPGAKMQFDLARQRVATLALLHRHLYEQRDTETVNLRSFFTQLMAQLVSAYGQRAQSSVSVVDMRVPPSVAIPLGLIVTEAVTNAMKYAFPEGRRGTIELLVTIENGRGHLMLRDDGIGIANHAGSESGMGDVLMKGFAEQVSGTLTVEQAPGGGTRIVLDFDSGEPPERPDPSDDTINAV
jgi:two-component sensor histidine kinase